MIIFDTKLFALYVTMIHNINIFRINGLFKVDISIEETTHTTNPFQ